MKRLALFASLALIIGLTGLMAFAASSPSSGAWTADAGPDQLQLNIWRGRSHQSGQTFAFKAFSGLTEAQVASLSETSVHFQMVREAGTISFEGSFKMRQGSGHFTFAPSPTFINAVKAAGVDVRELEGNDSDDDRMFELALHDVSTSFIRDMVAVGYKVSLEKYLSFRIFNVSPALVTELRELGYDRIPADELVATRIHGVTPRYIREMRAAGLTRLTLDDLVASRIHGVSPEFINTMRDVGYPELPFDDLVAFRIHGVTKDFISDLRSLGYTKVDADDLVAMRIHGVTPKYIREIQGAGYHGIPVEKLIAMRIQGVDADFMRKAGQ